MSYCILQRFLHLSISSGLYHRYVCLSIGNGLIPQAALQRELEQHRHTATTTTSNAQQRVQGQY